MSEFDRIKTETLCPYAHNAKIQQLDVWNHDKGFHENIFKYVEQIAYLVKSNNLADGFVLEVPLSPYGDSVTNLARFTNRLLKLLSCYDPTGDNCMLREIEHPTWQFSFARKRLFITTFAPCYPSTHARSSLGHSSTFIFFQPEESFQQHGIAKGLSPKQIRSNIRQLFADAGRPYYNAAIIDSPIDALCYVKPLELTDQPIRWWKA